MKLKLLKYTLLLVISLTVNIACSDKEKVNEDTKAKITVKGQSDVNKITKYLEILQMVAIGLPTTTEVTWSITSGELFAKINAKTGVVTAISDGKVMVTATSSTGETGSKEITIEIVPDPIPNPNSIVNIPDAKFKSYLINDADADTNGDGEIQYSEARDFTGPHNSKMMEIYFEVSDATGLEAFTGLRILRCLNNDNIKLLDLSKNTELYQVTVNNLTDLIGLEKLTKLEQLKINYCKIKSLDLRWNPKLNELRFKCKEDKTDWSDPNNPKEVTSSELTYLNLANGNTKGITELQLHLHTYLTCVKVDKGFTKPIMGWEIKESPIVLKNDGGDCD